MKGSLRIIIMVVLLIVGMGCGRDSSVWLAAWKETTPLSTKRSGAAAVAWKDHIYVIGGVDGKNFMKTMEFARIQEDGSLGPWKEGPMLNEARGFFDALVHDGHIYVVGGGNGPYGKNLLRSVERARIGEDGKLEEWQKEKFALTMPRRCSKVVSVGNRLFTLGGFGGDMLDTVEHSAVLDDGSLDEWFEEGEKLSTLRYIHGVKTVGDITYVVGGHHQTEGIGIADVEWSKVLDEAGYDAWKKSAPLNVGRYGLALTSHNGSLYALGGLTGAEYLDSVEIGRIASAGEIEPWRMTTPLFWPRAMASVVVYKDWIYIIGGTNRDGYLKSVEYATFNDKGDIGFRATTEEATIYEKRLEEKKKEKKAPLPNSGVVLKTMPTKRYVYILVATQKGDVWLAGPKMEINAGESISFSKGVFMSNFYSKELKLNFPAITFVGKVHRSQN